jgi:serine/threonine protein kinase/tetratricopeptide (TPR) repeat protein
VPEVNDPHQDPNQTVSQDASDGRARPAGDGPQKDAVTSPPNGRAGASSVQVPGYTILEVLGRGGMGVVYKARQDKANRLVALKMILSGTHASAAERQRFRAEAEAVALLAHPNIVQVHDVGETPEGHSFFSLEYVPGGTLAQRLRSGPLPPSEAAALIESLAGAMQHAHERGIVHRDLKPQNILLRAAGQPPTGDATTVKSPSAGPPSQERAGASAASQAPPLTPKISDFGLAKRHDDEEGLTQTGAIVGTPGYMAPEQAFGHSKHVGPAADVYALGAVLYECLTGRPPFRGVTMADTLDQVRTREPVAPREFSRAIPRDLETICLHCLRKEPERRYGSAEALAGDVRRFREGRPIAVRPVGAVERAWRWCRRNPRWAVMLAAVVLLLFGVTGVSLYAYVTVAAKNADIEAKNLAITQEAAATETQRQLAVEKGKLAEKRLLQSIDAVSLFAKDARVFCEDALVPGESRRMLYEVVIAQLEKSVDDSDGSFDEDNVRNKVLMYQQIGMLHVDLGHDAEAKRWYEKGLQLTERWLEAKPGDPAARGHHAAYLHLLGTIYQRAFNSAKADSLFKEALAIRRDVWSNLDYRKQVDRFTPGKSYTNLCDSLDTFYLFDESLKLREEAYQLFGTFELLDAWCWTCWKAGFNKAYAEKKAHLLKSAELCEELHKLRPTNRNALKRWAFVLSDLGNLEHSHRNLAEAQKYFSRRAEVNRKLATSGDLVNARQRYGFSWFDLGMIEKELGYDAKAREAFLHSRLIREELLRDYPDWSMYHAFQIDWLFSVVALGEHVTAVKTADELSVKHRDIAWAQYRLGLIYVRCSAAVAEACRPAPLTPEDKGLQDAYLKKALVCFSRAAEGQPGDYQSWEAFAGQLRWQKDTDGALAAYHKLLQRDPNNVPALRYLGLALQGLGCLKEAQQALHRGHELGSKLSHWKSPTAAMVKEIDRLVELEQLLPALAKGERAPASAKEQIELVGMCMLTRRYAAAAGFYADAFTAQPALTEDTTSQHRYDAACPAALAGTGRGADAATLPNDAKAKLRQQARAWLQAELDRYAEQLKGGKAELVPQVDARLTHWQADPDLAGVRDAKALAGLPAEEAEAWHTLWAEVAGLLQEARGRLTETTHKGTLTDQQLEQVHELKARAGTTYVIEMHSSVLDSYLKLLDTEGTVLAEHDDIDPGVNLDARLVFTPKEDGTYRVVATSFEQRGRGAYTLTIRAISAKPK